MSVLVQKFQLGRLATEWKRQLARVEKERVLERFWKQDLSLWPFYAPPKNEGTELLNWIGLVDQVEPSIVKISQLGDMLEGKGFTDVVFLAVSSSSLAAEIIPSLSIGTRGAKFHVLSLMEPSGLRAFERKLDFRKTVFLVASKSGKNLEMHSLLLYLLSRAKMSGLPLPAVNFIAITEEGSYLANLAREGRFLAVFPEPHGFRGRFSGVLHYGHLLGGLCKFDSSIILSRVREMQTACMPQTPLERNSAALLAAFFAAMAQSGITRIAFRAPPPLVPLAQRIGHLLGSSTCKEGKGIMPFVEADIGIPEILHRSFAICDVRFNGDAAPASAEHDVPAITIELGSVEDVPAEIYKWEVATCLACSLMEVNPFEDPDFGEARISAIQYVEELSSGKKIGEAQPRIVQGKIALFMEGELRQEISTLNLEQALCSFFSLRNEDAYIAILNYTWNLSEVTARLAAMARQISSELVLPAQLVTGPWYLHLLGQGYKGGPRGGIFLMITCDAFERIEVPGAAYSFGDLVHSLALGDFDAMNHGRHAILRLHLSGPAEESLGELEAAAGKALRTFRKLKQSRT